LLINGLPERTVWSAAGVSPAIPLLQSESVLPSTEAGSASVRAVGGQWGRPAIVGTLTLRRRRQERLDETCR